jgi:PAS domain S-box-containing protein
MSIISGFLSKSKVQRLLGKDRKSYREIKEELEQLKSNFKELDEKYHSIFDNTGNGCVILEPQKEGNEFIIRDFNNGAAKIEGIPKEEAIGSYFTDLFPKSSHSSLINAFKLVYQSGKTENIPFILREDNEIKHYHQNTIIKLSNGRLMVLYSERKELEKSREALEKSRERLKLTLESTQIGLWDHNLKTGEVYRSKEWAEMLGYTKEEIDGFSDAWKELIHPDDLKHVEENAEKHETRKTDSFQVEHRLKTKDGNYKWILNWGKIVDFDEDGKPLRAVGTHLDIDKRKKTEEKLAELNATKDRLFSIIGHDLKNPLADIIGFSSLLNKKYQNYSEEKAIRFIQLIHKSAITMHELLENLLKWSRFQREEALFDPGKVDITKIFNSMLDQFQTKADTKNISLTHTLEQPKFVYADKNMVETVLRNLISNALKYTPESGKVSAYTIDEKEKIIICIEDTGIGMEKEKADLLFKSNKSTINLGTNFEKGSGLGLLLCKEIIDTHNEQIWVESKPEKGSIFKFTLNKHEE